MDLIISAFILDFIRLIRKAFSLSALLGSTFLRVLMGLDVLQVSLHCSCWEHKTFCPSINCSDFSAYSFQIGFLPGLGGFLTGMSQVTSQPKSGARSLPSLRLKVAFLQVSSCFFPHSQLPLHLYLPPRIPATFVVVQSPSRVRLFAAPWTVVLQAPLSLAFLNSKLCLLSAVRPPGSVWTLPPCTSAWTLS